MTTVENALEAILEAVQPVGLETVPLVAAFGRILGEEVAAPRDHPPWDNAAMDGYAIRHEEAETAADGAEITVRREIRPGEDVRCCGEDVRLGEMVLSPGTVIGPPEIGILALAQRGCVAVSRRPRVAILATGEELVEPWERTGDWQIVNTNNYALAAQVAASGGEFQFHERSWIIFIHGPEYSILGQVASSA